MSTATEERYRRTAKQLATALTKAGYDAHAVDHGYAVRVDNEAGERLAIVWLPSGETIFNDLGDKYLWGRTGDEFQAPQDVELADLVSRIVATLS